MKVCSIVGSSSRFSDTFYFQNKFLRSFVMNFKEKIEISILDLSKYDIGFMSTNTNYDFNYDEVFENNEIKCIKQKMLESDIIIFSSPVYMNNVSGIMKNFLDYFSFWVKTMCLSGKFGIVLTNSSQQGGDKFVREYLSSILCNLGVVVVGEFSLYRDFPFQLYNSNVEEVLINDFVQESIVNLKKGLNSSKNLEKTFSRLKNNYTKEYIDYLSKFVNDEERFIKLFDKFEFNSFQEYLDYVASN